MEGGEKDVSPSPSKGIQIWNIPMATKLGTFHWPLSKMLLHWPPHIGFLPKAIKLGTFHWPPSKMFPHWPPSIGFLSLVTKLGFSLTSFLLLFFKGVNLHHLSFSSQMCFPIWIFENLFLELALEEKND